MDAEIATLREKIAEAKADEKALKANLGNVEATLSTEELKSSVVALQTEKEELLARCGPPLNMRPFPRTNLAFVTGLALLEPEA